MPNYALPVFGLEISFCTDAAPERVQTAKTLLESRFDRLEREGGNMSREKLLVFLALALADDYLQAEDKLKKLESRIDDLLHSVGGTAEGQEARDVSRQAV